MPSMQHQRLMRRAPRSTATEPADDGLTVPVAQDDETTTTRRRTRTRTTAVPATVSTSPSTAGRGNNSRTLSTPATSSPLSIPYQSVPSTSTSTSASAAATGVNAGQANNSTSKSSSSSGTLIGAVIAAVAAVILLAGLIFFFVRRKQRRQNTVDAGYRKNEKDDDDRSFIGGLSAPTSNPNNNGYANEKSYGAFDQAQAYGMQDMHNQQKGWDNNASQLSYVHTPPMNGGHKSFDSIDGMAQSQFNNAYPPNSNPQPVQNGFMSPPPIAAAQGTANLSPYGVAAAGGNSQPPVPPVIVQPSEADGPFADPQWANKLFKVTRTFQPNMPDELVIKTGDRIKILMAYDDGWCLGENLDGSGGVAQGVFPKDCVEEVGLSEVPLATAASFSTPSANSADPQSQQNQQAGLARAPTLPPLDISDDNNYRDSHIADAYFGANSGGSPTKSANKHTSSGSTQSLNHRSSMIDHFPTPSNAGYNSGKPVKRQSSLVAPRDANLFAALGPAINSTDTKS